MLGQEELNEKASQSATNNNPQKIDNYLFSGVYEEPPPPLSRVNQMQYRSTYPIGRSGGSGSGSGSRGGADIAGSEEEDSGFDSNSLQNLSLKQTGERRTAGQRYLFGDSQQNSMWKNPPAATTAVDESWKNKTAGTVPQDEYQRGYPMLQGGGNKPTIREELQEIIEGIPYPDHLSMTSISNSTHSNLGSSPYGTLRSTSKAILLQRRIDKQDLEVDANHQHNHLPPPQSQGDDTRAPRSWEKQNIVMANSQSIFPQIFAPSIEMSNENSLAKSNSKGRGIVSGITQQNSSRSSRDEQRFYLNHKDLQNVKDLSSRGSYPRDLARIEQDNDLEEQDLSCGETPTQPQNRNQSGYSNGHQQHSDRLKNSTIQNKQQPPQSQQLQSNKNSQVNQKHSQTAHPASKLSQLKRVQSSVLSIPIGGEETADNRQFVETRSVGQSYRESQDVQQFLLQSYQRQPSMVEGYEENFHQIEGGEYSQANLNDKQQGREFGQIGGVGGDEETQDLRLHVRELMIEMDTLQGQINHYAAQARQAEQQNEFYVEQIEDLEQAIRFLQEKHSDSGDIASLRGQELEKEKANSRRLKGLLDQKTEKIEHMFNELQLLESHRDVYIVEFKQLQESYFMSQRQLEGTTMQLQHTQYENEQFVFDIDQLQLDIQAKSKEIERILQTNQQRERSLTGEIGRIQKKLETIAEQNERSDRKLNAKDVELENLAINQQEFRDYLLTYFSPWINSESFTHATTHQQLVILRNWVSDLRFEKEGFEAVAHQSRKQQLQQRDRASEARQLKGEIQHLQEDRLDISSVEEKLRLSHLENTKQQERNGLKERQEFALKLSVLEKQTDVIQIALDHANERVRALNQQTDKLETEKQTLLSVQQSYEEIIESLEEQIQRMAVSSGNIISQLEGKVQMLQQQQLAAAQNSSISYEKQQQSSSSQIAELESRLIEAESVMARQSRGLKEKEVQNQELSKENKLLLDNVNHLKTHYENMHSHLKENVRCLQEKQAELQQQIQNTKALSRTNKNLSQTNLELQARINDLNDAVYVQEVNQQERLKLLAFTASSAAKDSYGGGEQTSAVAATSQIHHGKAKSCSLAAGAAVTATVNKTTNNVSKDFTSYRRNATANNSSSSEKSRESNNQSPNHIKRSNNNQTRGLSPTRIQLLSQQQPKRGAINDQLPRIPTTNTSRQVSQQGNFEQMKIMQAKQNHRDNRHQSHNASVSHSNNQSQANFHFESLLVQPLSCRTPRDSTARGHTFLSDAIKAATATNEGLGDQNISMLYNQPMNNILGGSQDCERCEQLSIQHATMTSHYEMLSKQMEMYNTDFQQMKQVFAHKLEAENILVFQLQRDLAEERARQSDTIVAPEMLSAEQTLDLMGEILRKVLRSENMKSAIVNSHDMQRLLLIMQRNTSKQFSSTNSCEELIKPPPLINSSIQNASQVDECGGVHLLHSLMSNSSRRGNQICLETMSNEKFSPPFLNNYHHQQQRTTNVVDYLVKSQHSSNPYLRIQTDEEEEEEEARSSPQILPHNTSNQSVSSHWPLKKSRSVPSHPLPHRRDHHVQQHAFKEHQTSIQGS